jgi:aminoglycoside phosphotransferase (APT) family kinase protein
MKDQSITPNHEVAVGDPACDLVIAWTYLSW